MTEDIKLLHGDCTLLLQNIPSVLMKMFFLMKQNGY